MEEALRLRRVPLFDQRNRLVKDRLVRQRGIGELREKFVVGADRVGPFMGKKVGVADHLGHFPGPRLLREEGEIAPGLGDRPVVLACREEFAAELPDLLFPQGVVLCREVVGSETAPGRQQEADQDEDDMDRFHARFRSKKEYASVIIVASYTLKRDKNQSLGEWDAGPCVSRALRKSVQFNSAAEDFAI